MAKIKYLLQSKSENAPIYLRLSIDHNTSIKRKTGLFISPKDWSKATGFPKQNSPNNKNIAIELNDLSASIFRNVNDANSNGVELSGDWLVRHIDLHFGRIVEEIKDNSLIGHIQRMIDFAPTKRMRNGRIGLSKNRVKGYITFKGLIEEYQNEIGNEIQLSEINPLFEDDFGNWLLVTKEYSRSYAGKSIDNLKAVCSDAERMGKEVHSHAKNIQGFSENKDDRFIITLSLDELDTIRGLKGLTDSMNNVRNWLLLGCELGQRAGDLLGLTSENFCIRNGMEFVDVEQEKTGKKIPIAVRPSIKELIKDGMPYRISIQRFNEYLKDLCQLAGLDSPTEGKVYDKEKRRKITDLYPKYKLITSHICRRSFATNYYKKMPTPLLMFTTGHSKESLFLAYIGEKEDKDEDAKMMMKYALIVEEERRKEMEKRKQNQKVTMKKVHKKI